MGKRKKIIILIMIISLLQSNLVCAETNDASLDYASEASITNTTNSSTSMLQLRGAVIAEASTTLTNEGDGKLRGAAHTLCYVEVENIYMRLLLQEYNEAGTSWNTVAIQEYDYDAEDFPNEIFSARTVSFEISNLKSGNYYRLAGLHSVTKKGIVQTYSTQTDGIKLKSYRQ